MGAFSTVDCCEVAFSRQESLSREGFDASVQLRALWTDRVALFNDLPDHPWPDESSAIVVGMTMKPEPGGTFTQDDQECVPEYVIFDVKYSNNTEKKEEEDTISETLEKSVEFVTLDYRKFRWNEQYGKPLLEAEAPGMQQFMINLVRTHYRVSPVGASVMDLAGKCNQAAYTSVLLGKTFPIETLLYTGPSLDRTINRTGPGPWNVKLVFGYKPQEWNRFWHPDTGTWDEIYSLELGAIYKNYPPADLSALLY